MLATKAELYPSLSFGANSGTGYYNMSHANNEAFGKQLKNNLTTSVGLTLSIPIFNKFDVQNRVKIAQNGVENSKLDIQNTKLEMKKSIQQAYYNATGSPKPLGSCSEVGSGSVRKHTVLPTRNTKPDGHRSTNSIRQRATSHRCSPKRHNRNTNMPSVSRFWNC